MRKVSSLKFTIIWSIVIYFLLLLPANDVPDVKINIPYLDKTVHFLLFAILVIAGFLDKKRLRNVVIYAVTTGIITEFLQYITNIGRNGDLFDLTADFAGIFVAVIFILKIKKRATEAR